jgi:predicted ATPase/DNA-binding winged helix-turn-helix (wHTH) protein
MDASAVSFGPFRLVAAQRLLLEGDKPVRLGSRAFDILTALVEHAGEVVGKEELIARAWPRTFVEEANLKIQVSALRRALGDGQDGHRYVVTVPGRGYNFVSPVSHQEPAQVPLPPTITAAGVHNLPLAVTRMIGRDEAVAALVSRLSRQRLVTILGPGGIGKTTVALAVAERMIASYEHGVWLVDLAPLGDPRLVPSTVATVLGLEMRTEDPFPGLVAGLRDKRMLLLLDNCEHVIDAAASLVAAVLRGAPGVNILATSRELLGVAGEGQYRLGPLDSPPPSSGLTAAEAAAFPAVQLFVERVTAIVEDFKLTDANALLVVEICRKLDGLPLAIEFAAPRVEVLGVEGLAADLDDSLRLLGARRRTAMPRHRTMRAVVDWSYGLLSEDEQLFFRALGIFTGGFTVEAATAVAMDAAKTRIDAIDRLADLVAKSLVVADVGDARPRFRLLETTRANALEKLAGTGEADAVARRHATYYAELFEGATDPGGADDDVTALEIDNVREALSWAFGTGGDLAIGVRLAAGSAPLWVSLSLLAECHGWQQKAIESLDAADLRGTRQEMVLQAALGMSLQFAKGLTAEACSALNRALELAQQLGDAEYGLRITHAQWVYHVRLGEVRAMLALARRAEAAAAAIADPVAVQTVDRMLGISFLCAGELAASRERLERMLAAPPPPSRRAYIRRFGFDQWVVAQYALAQLLFLQGYPEQAAQAGLRAVEEGRELQHDVTLCGALAWAGSAISLRIGDFEGSRRFAAELIHFSVKHSLADYHALGIAIQAFLSLKDGASGSGIEPIRQSLERWHAAKWHIYLTMSDFAEAVANAGYLDEISAMLDETLERAERNQELWAMPEALRLKGELLLLAAADPGAAQAHFDRSIGLARAQGALAWELRTAMSIASLQRKRHRTEQARQVLQAAYERFTEGFETADLKRAKQLLDELGGARRTADRPSVS